MGLLTVAFLDLEEMPTVGSNAQQRGENVSPLQRLRLGVGDLHKLPSFFPWGPSLVTQDGGCLYSGRA